MNNPKYYEELASHIEEHLEKLLGDGFNISYTGTIDPRYYEGHMKMADTAGLKIYINQVGHKAYPTMKQITDYFDGFKK